MFFANFCSIKTGIESIEWNDTKNIILAILYIYVKVLRLTLNFLHIPKSIQPCQIMCGIIWMVADGKREKRARFVRIFLYRFGRRNPLVWAVIIQVATGTAAAFSPWFWLFLIMRFLSACATGGTMVTSFVLVMELIGMVIIIYLIVLINFLKQCTINI